MRAPILITAFATIAFAGILPAQRTDGRAVTPRSMQFARSSVRSAAVARTMDEALLQGIALSHHQQVALDALRIAERSSTDAVREDDRKLLDALRAARAARDADAVRERMHDHLARFEARRWEHFAAVRGLLTPAQRSTFDANVTAMFGR